MYVVDQEIGIAVVVDIPKNHGWHEVCVRVELVRRCRTVDAIAGAELNQHGSIHECKEVGNPIAVQVSRQHIARVRNRHGYREGQDGAKSRRIDRCRSDDLVRRRRVQEGDRARVGAEASRPNSPTVPISV